MGDFIEDDALTLPSTCFTCTRLNSTTFRIIEDDIYDEQPFIYVKVIENALIIIDTGCGGAARDSHVELTSLREFLEIYPVRDNEDQPLNPHGRKDYIILCTHCHYDHILGIPSFPSPQLPVSINIWASSHDKTFLSQENLPTNSLCHFLAIPTPQYTVTNWAHDGAALLDKHEKDLGLTFYHTPGHTPDSLTIFDPHERVLYVGDSFYQYSVIIFPKEGSLADFSRTMLRLRKLVDSWNAMPDRERVTVACGHSTSDADAARLLRDVDRFLWDIVDGREKLRRQEVIRGEVNWFFAREDGGLSMRVPARLVLELREYGEKRAELGEGCQGLGQA